MRSRYAAYALGRLDYIAATCAGPAAAAFDLREVEQSQLGTRWLGLEILGTRKGREGDDDGTVSFIARYSHNGAGGELEETSTFRRLDGRWVYRNRLNKLAAPRGASVGRNDPCPCGSGKKYKKCCGG